MNHHFKNLVKDLSLDNHRFVVDVIEPETNITLYKKEGKEFMLKYADTIEDWFGSLATKHKVNKIEVIKFKTCNNIYLKSPVIHKIIYDKSNTDGYKKVLREAKEKLTKDFENTKILQGYFMQQFRMYLNDKCSYEELKRVGQIVTTEINNK